MSKKAKKEQVSLSFHFMTCSMDTDDDHSVPITRNDFMHMYNGLVELKNQDYNSPEFIKKIRFRSIAIIKEVERVNEQTISGIFENSYWGHSFRNSDKGNISADSLNYRPFLFLMYLSDSGKIYIACQYLGTYGGYLAMKNTIEYLYKKRNKLHFHSINMFSTQIENLIPTEVIFDVAKQPKTISGKNTFSQALAIALKDKDKTDEYKNGIKSGILSLFKKPKAQIRSGLTKFLRDNDLISIQDDEIQDCRVIAKINKKFVTIHMLDEANYATKFQVDVPLMANGHPEYEPLKIAAINTLRDRVISRNEDV